MGPEDLIARGFYLFPLHAKDNPAIKWKEGSSNDLTTIRNWKARWPNCIWGIDCGKSGVFVLDDDRGKDPDAADSLLALELEYGTLPPTFTVRTPSSGFHYYTRGLGKSTIGAIGKGLDTKSTSGYVVAFCSPGYTIENDIPFAEVPAWLVTLAEESKPRRERSTIPLVELDCPSSHAMATLYLHAAQPAIEGDGGDKATLDIALQLKDYGVSEAQIPILMAEHWNERCSPPWSMEELEVKAANAYLYGQNAPGSANPEGVFTVFEDDTPTISTPISSLRPLFIDARDLIRKDLTINYLIDGLIETPTTGLIFGESTAGKSFLTIAMSLAVAFGTSWMGGAAKQGRTLYFNGEGHVGFARRLWAWLRYYNFSDIDEGLLTVTQRRVEMSEKSIVQLEPMIKQNISKYGPLDLIHVDTMARHLASGSDENSAKDIGGYINAVDYLKDRFQCTVATVHHPGKGNKDVSRGSSAIRGALDWEFKVAGGELKFFKQKDGELPRPMGFALEQVDIGKGKTSAVAIPCAYDPTHGTVSNLGSHAMLAYSILQFAISTSKNEYLEEKVWREEFYQAQGVSVKAGTKCKNFDRAKKDLVAAKTIKYESDRVYDICLNPAESED